MRSVLRCQAALPHAGQPAVGPHSGQDIAKALRELAGAQKALAAEMSALIAAAGRDTVAGVTAAIKAHFGEGQSQHVDSPCSLGLCQARGHEGMPLPEVPKSFPQCDGFDMSWSFNEDESTPDFVTFVQASLKRAGAPAVGTQPGFSVRDLHTSDGKMVIDKTTCAGILDAGVVPILSLGQLHASAPRWAGAQANPKAEGFVQGQPPRREVHPQPAEYEQKQRLAKKRKAEPFMAMPADAAGGLPYSGTVKGQAVLVLLGAYACAEWPLALYVTNGTDWHRLLLTGKDLYYWEELTIRQAMHCMVTELKEATTDCHFSFADSRSARRLRPDLTEPGVKLKPLVGDNMLSEQLEAVLPFVNEEDKDAVALQLLQAHRPCEDEISVPEWLRSMYS